MIKIRHIVGLLLGSTALSGAAMADGWNGLYVGIQGGYANLPSNGLTATLSPFASDATLNGGLIGVSLGLNHQLSNNFVMGISGDWSVSNAAGSGQLYGPGSPFTLTLQSLGKVQARAGYAFGASNDNLIYVGGGLAFANVQRTGFPSNVSNGHIGYALSAGFEHMISDSVSIKAEASYVNLGSKDYGTGGESVKLGGLIGTLGVNFHF